MFVGPLQQHAGADADELELDWEAMVAAYEFSNDHANTTNQIPRQHRSLPDDCLVDYTENDPVIVHSCNECQQIEKKRAEKREKAAAFGPANEDNTCSSRTLTQPSCTIASLPSIALQLINQYCTVREIMTNHVRVNHAFNCAAANPFSTATRPVSDALDPEEDHSQFLMTRSSHVWPWFYHGYHRANENHAVSSQLNEQLKSLVESRFIHAIRVWPNIPLRLRLCENSNTAAITDILSFVQLKYLHTIHISTDSDEECLKHLFSISPFPFRYLHSLSMPRVTSALISRFPSLPQLRRLALTEPFNAGQIVPEADWIVLAAKLSHLIYFDAFSREQPQRSKVPKEKGMIRYGLVAFIRALGATLREVECDGIFSKTVLTAILSEPFMNIALESIRDTHGYLYPRMGFRPNREETELIPLDDVTLQHLIRFPSLVKLTQPGMMLSSIQSLFCMSSRLRELTLQGQQFELTQELEVEWTPVFSQLYVLSTLKICDLPYNLFCRQRLDGVVHNFRHDDESGGSHPLPPPEDPAVVRARREKSARDFIQLQQSKDGLYVALLAAIRTIPYLRRLTLEQLPLQSNHLDALLGQTETIAHSNETLISHDATSSSSSSASSLASLPARSGLSHLTELNLILINGFLHECIRLPRPIRFERLMDEGVLSPLCRLTLRGVKGISPTCAVALKQHFGVDESMATSIRNEQLRGKR